MKKVLHLISTPKEEGSRTLQIAEALFSELKKKFPDCKIDELNLFKEELPELSLKIVNGKYMLLAGNDLSGDSKLSWERFVIPYIERFMAAEMIVISTPMWNFGIPYKLKHFIDIIFQPRYLFRYTEKGVEGLAKDKKVVVLTSRGGDYGLTSPAHSMDNQEPYLRIVFSFVGIKDITFIAAQPMDALGEQVRNEKIAKARQEAVRFIKNL